jgi:subtilisin family serine protease
VGDPVEATGLQYLMRMTAGDSSVAVGLLDGAVAPHPDLEQSVIRRLDSTDAQSSRSTAHGTFVAGILASRRGSPAPSICPGVTLLVRSVFPEDGWVRSRVPGTSADVVAAAIVQCVDSGARLLNLSFALMHPYLDPEPCLEKVVSYAARRGVLVIAAAGNDGTVTSSAVARHMWLIPVAAFNINGRPIRSTNIGASVGRRGLGAPGEAIRSLAPERGYAVAGGTSIAAAFVTGAAALLWSLFPSATAADIKNALTPPRSRSSVSPPFLDARRAYYLLAA